MPGEKKPKLVVWICSVFPRLQHVELSLRGDVVERRHPETSHHGPAPLLGQQLVPDHFLGLERMFCLKEATRKYLTG